MYYAVFEGGFVVVYVKIVNDSFATRGIENIPVSNAFVSFLHDEATL
jgi:hypothetical protein